MTATSIIQSISNGIAAVLHYQSVVAAVLHYQSVVRKNISNSSSSGNSSSIHQRVCSLSFRAEF